MGWGWATCTTSHFPNLMRWKAFGNPIPKLVRWETFGNSQKNKLYATVPLYLGTKTTKTIYIYIYFWLTAQPTPIRTRFSNLCRSSVLKSSSRPQPRFAFIHPGPFISDCWANQPKTSANGSMPSAWDLERARLSKTTMTNFLHPHYLTRMTLMMTTGSHLRLPAQSQIDQAT